MAIRGVIYIFLRSGERLGINQRLTTVELKTNTTERNSRGLLFCFVVGLRVDPQPGSSCLGLQSSWDYRYTAPNQAGTANPVEPNKGVGRDVVVRNVQCAEWVNWRRALRELFQGFPGLLLATAQPWYTILKNTFLTAFIGTIHLGSIWHSKTFWGGIYLFYFMGFACIMYVCAFSAHRGQQRAPVPWNWSYRPL